MHHRRHKEDRIYYDNIRCELLDFDRGKPKPVLNKTDFYERFYKGEFGNYGLMWSTLHEWWHSYYEYPIAIRTLKPGGRCDYNIPRNEVFDRVSQFHSEGWKELNFSAMAPTERTLLQGEALLTVGGLHLFVSQLKLPMRDALKQGGFHANGIIAYRLLRETCDPDSYDWLQYLLENYEDHVVEFSTFECAWGMIERKNTVIWEVRKY
jgi:hypothetical protein